MSTEIEKNNIPKDDLFDDVDGDVSLIQEENAETSLDDKKEEDEKLEKEKISPEQEIHFLHTSLLHASMITEKYSFTPKIAITTSGSGINSLSLTKHYKFLFLGGDDGFLRKYNFIKSLKGESPLTIQQKHFVVDGVMNNGYISSYTPNEILQKKSEIKFPSQANQEEYYPVKSKVLGMDVHSECDFSLVGQENGDVLLQGCRYKEGKLYHLFREQDNTGMNNFIKLNKNEDCFYSVGFFDKRLRKYDLNTGNLILNTVIGDSQLSSLEFRPLHGDPISDKSHESDIDMLFEDEDEDNENDDKLQQGDRKIYDDYINKDTLKMNFDENVLLTSQLNGKAFIYDTRINTSPTVNQPVLSLDRLNETPPWSLSACWDYTGNKVFIGRRNASFEIYDIRNPSKPEKTVRLPKKSGEVTCVKTMPNNKQVICGSIDNIRVYDLDQDKFNIIPGHHGGFISNIVIDPTSRFMFTTSGNRGVLNNQNYSTDLTFVYNIDNQ